LGVGRIVLAIATAVGSVLATQASETCETDDRRENEKSTHCKSIRGLVKQHRMYRLSGWRSLREIPNNHSAIVITPSRTRPSRTKNTFMGLKVAKSLCCST